MAFTVGLLLGVLLGWVIFEKPEVMRNATDTVKGWVKKESE